MIGCLSIDFHPDEAAVARILAVLEHEDFALRGLRLLPCAGEERSTLRVDLGGRPSRTRLEALEHRLRTVDQTIAVIHWANAEPA